ncbi:TetR/AcrR family transcriptional regulator [Paenibacillus sp. P96]|uniref:TetR/AcrR family transcriptional regulator n=1 Tax=Paenibacillus zeirhizosphaerae TaxID=2987519 RepID=A0ABT9FTA6_9BACL|nr:TetR/AcrR family transcriptional regulator [Paenibacillus sp. P96]MDP4097958.1 TetR/AcrR family transcriptional regulator [Paenibacillus sp. P96]
MHMNTNDPRVKRTRQLLMQAFMELLEQKKSVSSITIQDITAYATVNRSTFYAHFEDKFAFLESWMREKFQEKLKNELPNAALSDIGSLRTLILIVFDFLFCTRPYMTLADRQHETLFEAAMQKELYDLLFTWLSEQAEPFVSRETVETTALIASWGIFGAAVEWSRHPQYRSAEDMARDVLVVVAAGLAPVLG